MHERLSESIIQREIRLALGKRKDLVLWRNNTGVAKHVTTHVRYGLCVGSSDLIGILRMPDGIGRFVALECKTRDGRTTEDQDLFLNLVRNRGGFAAVVRSVADAEQAIARALTGADS